MSRLVCGVLLAISTGARAEDAKPEVVASFPHDPEAFTQGLLLHEGRFYESTGLEGRSSVRRVVPATGEVELNVALASDVFGEGLALVGDRLIQLTWQDQIAFVYDLALNPIGSFAYEGEGWGLCYDGTRLVMSDGSSRLFFRDPVTFELLGDVAVTNGGTPVVRLNELECVADTVFANVWLTNTIVQIDPATGDVLQSIDASGLLTAEEAAQADVLNGIAFDPASGHFFITGKLWPRVFEVRFTPDAGGSGGMGGASGGAAGQAGSGGVATGGAPSAGGTSGSGGAGGAPAGGGSGAVPAEGGSSGTIGGAGAAGSGEPASGGLAGATPGAGADLGNPGGGCALAPRSSGSAARASALVAFAALLFAQRLRRRRAR